MEGATNMTRMIFFKKRKALLINEDTVKQLQEFNGIGHGRFAQILAGSRMTEPFEKKLALTYEKHMTELRYPKKNECLAFYFSKIEGPTSFETRNRYSLFKVSLDYNIEVEEISVLHFAPDKTLPKKGQGCLQLLPHAKFNFAEQDKGFIHRHFFVDRWEDGTLLKGKPFRLCVQQNYDGRRKTRDALPRPARWVQNTLA